MHGVGHLVITVHFSLKSEDINRTRHTLKFAKEVARLRFVALGRRKKLLGRLG